jgi:hypothetical protein
MIVCISLPGDGSSTDFLLQPARRRTASMSHAR